MPKTKEKPAPPCIVRLSPELAARVDVDVEQASKRAGVRVNARAIVEKHLREHYGMAPWEG